MTIRSALLAPAAALLLAGCAAGAASVRADGWAAEDPARPGLASRRAVADALRRAVERTAGVSVTGRTRVKDGAAVSERVLADAAGCVLSYEVLSERSENGGRTAAVRARVARGAGPCAGRPALPVAALDDAVVSISVKGEGEHGREAARAAESALRAALLARGWRVMAAPAPLRVTAVASLAAAADPRLGPLAGQRAELLLRIERTDRAAVLHESSSRAAATDAEPVAAARKAARRAADAAASEAAESLEAGRWQIPNSD